MLKSLWKVIVAYRWNLRKVFGIITRSRIEIKLNAVCMPIHMILHTVCTIMHKQNVAEMHVHVSN